MDLKKWSTNFPFGTFQPDFPETFCKWWTTFFRPYWGLFRSPKWLLWNGNEFVKVIKYVNQFNFLTFKSARVMIMPCFYWQLSRVFSRISSLQATGDGGIRWQTAVLEWREKRPARDGLNGWWSPSFSGLLSRGVRACLLMISIWRAFSQTTLFTGWWTT